MGNVLRLTGLLFLISLFTATPLLSGGVYVTVKDSTGRLVRVRTPVSRVVAMNSDVLEVLRALKAQGLVVGVFSEIDREKEFWGELAEKPRVGSWREADPEAIVSLRPDLVIAYSQNPGAELERRLAPFNIPVLRLDFYRVEAMEGEVTLLGRLLGHEEEATEFCNWYREKLEAIRNLLKQVKQRPRVYVESYTDYHTVAPGSGGHEMCVLAGGENIAAHLSVTYPRVTPEWVVTQNPDVIVKAVAWGGGYARSDPSFFNDRRKGIMDRAGWQHIKAVQTGRVHVIDSSIWTGPRAVIGIAYLVRWFHPEVSSAVNPEAWHREYLEVFQRVPYRGIYVSQQRELR